MLQLHYNYFGPKRIRVAMQFLDLVARAWNSLPQFVTDCTSFSTFRYLKATYFRYHSRARNSSLY